MNFLKTVRNSIYSPKFYLEAPKKSLGTAIGYFFLLILFLTIIQSIPIIHSFLTVGQQEIKKFVSKVKDFYPEELEIKIKNGQVSTNVEEPYFIPSPFKTDDKIIKENSNLIVIDTKTPFSISQFNQYKTYVWLAKDSIIFNNDGQIQTNDLSGVSDVTINKAFATKIIDQFLPWLNLVTPVVIVFVLIGFYIAYTLRLIYLFFFALLIFLLSKLLKKSLKYGESYKIGLYAMTTGFLIDLILNLTHIPGFAWMFTLVSLAIVLINFQTNQKTTTTK